MGLTEILAHARSRVSAAALGSSDKIKIYREIFERCNIINRKAPLHIFTFHARVPVSYSKIRYVDVVHNHHDFDYDKIFSHFIRSARYYNPDAVIWAVTSLDDHLPVFHDANIQIVRLPLNSTAPMLERVRAMTAYVSSGAFAADTAFLDTDAFVNALLSPVFDAEFDIGVTIRPTEDFYMPLNEGVIFARHARSDAVRCFFSKYIGTYDQLMTDSTVGEYYGDIARWRGGQLSLNAVAGSYAADSADVRVKTFDCDLYNYWARPELEFEPDAWNRKVVLHLKGDSKYHMQGFMEYHAARMSASRGSERSLRSPQ